MSIRVLTIKVFLITLFAALITKQLPAQAWPDTLLFLKKPLSQKKPCAGCQVITMPADSNPTGLNSLQANKQHYINQPLSKLLGDFTLPISDYLDDLPLPNYPDTIQLRSICFDFYKEQKDVTNFYLRGKKPGPSIYIEFVNPVPVPKKYLRHGYMLDGSTPWNTTKAIFYGPALVKDFRVVE